MPGSYSRDLRERVLLACERGRLSRAKIAALFQVAESTVYRWLQTWRREGRREAKDRAPGRGVGMPVLSLVRGSVRLPRRAAWQRQYRRGWPGFPG